MLHHSTPATGLCAYFEDAYPAQHARLLSEGRLLLYCPSSSGFGAWLYGLQSLVVASVLTERALILACPGFATCGDGRGVERTIRKWFRGRGFDWQPEGWERSPGVTREGELPVPPSRSYFPDRSWRMSPPVFHVAEWHLQMRWPHPIVYNRTHVSGLLVTDHPSVVKLCAGEHTAPDKLFARGPGSVQNAALFRARTGIEKWSGRSMQCALRAFLEPTAALRHTMGRVVPENAPFVVMHARLGDGSMQREASSTRWKWSKERRQVFRNGTATDGALRGVLDRFAAEHEALPHVVVTDTQRVAELAEERGMLTTRKLGRPVHLGQTDVSHVSEDDVSALYADWLLIRRAAHAYRLGQSTLMLSARVAAGDPENITTFS